MTNYNLIKIQGDVLKLRPDARAYRRVDNHYAPIIILVCVDGLYDRIAIAESPIEAWREALKHLETQR